MADFPFFKDDEKKTDEKNKKVSHSDDDTYLDDMETLLGTKVEGSQKRRKRRRIDGKNNAMLWGIILVLSLVVIGGALYISLRSNGQVHMEADERQYKRKILDDVEEGLPMEGGDNIYTFLERQQKEGSDVPEHATQIPADTLADERSTQKEEESRQWRGNDDSFSISEDFIEAQDMNENNPPAVVATKAPAKAQTAMKAPEKSAKTQAPKPAVVAPKASSKPAGKTENKAKVETKAKPIDPWKAQLVVTKIEQNAEAEWARLQKKYPKLFESKSREIKKATLNGETVYKLWVVPFDSQSSAQAFCKKAKDNGISCMPLK